MSVYAGQVRQALAAAIDTTALAGLWQALHPEGAGDVSRPVLREFLGRAREAIERALRAVLDRLWPEAWVLGERSAEALVAALEDVDWGGWTPGDAEAAMEIAGPGLRELLRESGVVIKSIADTRIEQLSDVLERSLSSDITQREFNGPKPLTLSVQSLADQLQAVLDNPGRAELVAQAEIARAQSSAAMRVYAENGTREVDWSTAEDAKVCPLCDANAAQGPVPIGTSFVSGAKMPPQHPRCFPAGTLVSGPAATAATDRHYEGDLAVVVFASGDDLAVTPNHPVLTRGGWVAAGSLHEGDHVLRARNRVEAELACPDDDQVVRRIEDVAAALAEAGPVTSVLMPCAAEDFHGDGSPGHDVNVVAAAGRIESHADAPEREDGADLPFVLGADAPGLGQGDGDALSLAGSASPAGGVGGVEHGCPASLAGSLPAQPHGLGLVAGGHASVGEHACHGTTADAVTDSQGLDRLSGEEVFGKPGGRGMPAPVLEQAGLVEGAVQGSGADASDGRALADALSGKVGTDCVVELRRVKWSGHVYNLETVSGWYFANGIIAHNCRCALLPVLVRSAA